jgi:hypothetical protein
MIPDIGFGSFSRRNEAFFQGVEHFTSASTNGARSIAEGNRTMALRGKNPAAVQGGDHAQTVDTFGGSQPVFHP